MESETINTSKSNETEKVHVKAILRIVLLQVGCIVLGCLAATNHVINAYLGDLVVKPIYSTAAIFVLGTLILFTISFIHSRISGRAFFIRRKGIEKIHWYEPLGGVFIAIAIVGGVYLIPQLGAATFCALALAGALCSATVLDHRGAFGLPIRKARYAAAISLILVFIGLIVSLVNGESQPHTSMGIVPHEQYGSLSQPTVIGLHNRRLHSDLSEPINEGIPKVSWSGEEQSSDHLAYDENDVANSNSDSPRASPIDRAGEDGTGTAADHESNDGNRVNTDESASSGWENFDFESEFERNMWRLKKINHTQTNHTQKESNEDQAGTLQADETNDRRQRQQQHQQASGTPRNNAPHDLYSSNLQSPTTPPDGKPLMYAKLVGFSLLSFLSGVANPIGATLNWRMAKILPHKSQSLAFSYLVASLLAIVTAALVFSTSAETASQVWSSIVHTPVWAWAGLPGMLVLLAGGVLLPRRVGTATYFVGLLVGEMAASLFFDGVGVLGLEKRAPSVARVLGVLVVVSGAMCLRSSDDIDAVAEVWADRIARKLGRPSRLRRRFFHTSTFGIVIEDSESDIPDAEFGKEQLYESYRECGCEEKRRLYMGTYGKAPVSPCNHCRSSTEEEEFQSSHNRHSSIVYNDLVVPDSSGHPEDPGRCSPYAQKPGFWRKEGERADADKSNAQSARGNSNGIEHTLPPTASGADSSNDKARRSHFDFGSAAEEYSAQEVGLEGKGTSLDAHYAAQRQLFVASKAHSAYDISRPESKHPSRGERRMRSESDLVAYLDETVVFGTDPPSNISGIGTGLNIVSSTGVPNGFTTSSRVDRAPPSSITSTTGSPGTFTRMGTGRTPSTRNLVPFDPFLPSKKTKTTPPGLKPPSPWPQTIELKRLDLLAARPPSGGKVGSTNNTTPLPPPPYSRRVLSEYDSPITPRTSFSQIHPVHSVVSASPQMDLEDTDKWEKVAGSKEHLVNLSRNASGRHLIPFEYSPNQGENAEAFSVKRKNRFVPTIKRSMRKLFAFKRSGSPKKAENSIPLIETLPGYKMDPILNGANDHRLAAKRKYTSMRDLPVRDKPSLEPNRRLSIAHLSRRHIKQSSMNFIGTGILPDDD